MICSICNGFTPSCPSCGHMQRTHRERPITLAPIVSKFDGGAVFKGGGNSHFTFDKDGFHETTEVPGLKLKQDVPIKIRTNF